MGCVRCVAQAASRQTGGREGSRRPVTALGTSALAREAREGRWGLEGGRLLGDDKIWVLPCEVFENRSIFG